MVLWIVLACGGGVVCGCGIVTSGGGRYGGAGCDETAMCAIACDLYGCLVVVLTVVLVVVYC